MFGSARGAEGQTRPRAMAAMLAGFGSLFVLHHLVSASVLAVNFTTSDEFKIYTNYVQGIAGAGFISQNNGAVADADGGVLDLGLKTAKLAGLCMISDQDVAGVGQVSIIISGGVPVRHSFDSSALVTTDGMGNPITYDAAGLLSGASATQAVSVTDLFLSSDALDGYANKLAGLSLGQSAEQAASDADLTFGTDKGGSAPTPGTFGLGADRLNISGLNGEVYGVDLAGSAEHPGGSGQRHPG